MAARSSTPNRVPARSSRGGTLLGFIIGLIVGLGVALAVALYVSHAPVPFVSRTARAPQRVVSPIAGNAELPDPNRSLYAQENPVRPGGRTASGASVAPGGAPIDTGLMDDRAQPPGEAPIAATPRAPVIPPLPESKPVSPDGSPGAPTVDITQSETAASGGSSYFLQVGAYRSKEDAESNRARLTMQGFDVKVMSAELNGNTIYRVRLGPYPKLDELNRVRSKLAENNIEVSIVKVR